VTALLLTIPATVMLTGMNGDFPAQKVVFIP
jgi:hypothetical protein